MKYNSKTKLVIVSDYAIRCLKDYCDKTLQKGDILTCTPDESGICVDTYTLKEINKLQKGWVKEFIENENNFKIKLISRWKDVI